MAQVMNKELNKAIWTVLKAKYKKEAPEAFKAVENAGYYTYKNGDGRWVVSNDSTGRYIRLQELGVRKRGRTIIQHGPYTWHSHNVTENELFNREIAFDFVACLEKPVNRVWPEVRYPSERTSKAVCQYMDIKSSQGMVDMYNREIEATQRKIAQLQESLIGQVERKMRYEQEVAAKKQKYGVSK